MRLEFFISSFIFLSCFLFISSCEFLKQDSQKSHIPTNLSSKACQIDADCVLVDTACCGCNAGGESVAIHKSQENSYNSELKTKCSGQNMCKQWYRCDNFKAQCHNSQCITVKK